MAEPQGNPSVAEMLANHELASRTISQHRTPLEIFDGSELDLLELFVNDPTEDNATKLLRDRDMYDGEDAKDRELGIKAQQKGSLAGFLIARYGNTNHATLTEDEVKTLGDWFKNGGGK